ncbi:hypothetical protein CRE_23876 [Caenorhabditis remanei]|uniref:Uncharacterized protein n=1 Tax=Caenorhabditis remanei TaxID=31234 RepID=E3MG83_CAERE|nr:hypothetical protein CRE_23876 [Caenorhabditis remanei]
MESEKIEIWKASFREIYKRSPTRGDFSVAPNDIKALLKSKEKVMENTEDKQVKRGVKRSNFESKMMEDEQFSPVKKRVKYPKLDLEQEENSQVLRTSPRKKIFLFEKSPTKTFSEKRVMSPRKKPVGTTSFDFHDLSPLKSYSGSASKSAVKCTLTPIKSPTKQPYQRQFLNTVSKDTSSN